MKTNLDKKIDLYEATLLTRFQRNFEIDFTKIPARSDSQIFADGDMIKICIDEYYRFQEKQEGDFDELIKLYFEESPVKFNSLLASTIALKISTAEIRQWKTSINQIALSIAWEKIKMTVVSYLIDISPNN
jgi:hypothetical protein